MGGSLEHRAAASIALTEGLELGPGLVATVTDRVCLAGPLLRLAQPLPDQLPVARQILEPEASQLQLDDSGAAPCTRASCRRLQRPGSV